MRSTGETAEALRAAGLRATAPRTAVLAVLRAAESAHEHLSAAQVAERARANLGALSTQAVYDGLEALVGAGLARRIRPADATSAVYEARVGDNHHHLVCRGCGLTVDADCAVGAAPCLLPALAAVPVGFTVDEAEVVFWGRCAACRAAERAGAPHGLPRPDRSAPEEETR